jgi:ATP-dependent helicase HrpA
VSDAGRAALSLPIYEAEGDIVAALREHRVLVVEGPTGSGKTTQLPRILRRHGFANRRIGITQPRRIAAVSVARRIAEEEDEVLGEAVGYAIRFEDLTSPRTQIKLMTDGILLQEARGDEQFEQYSVLVIDEAHERSLNIDVCLGLLHRCVARGGDLRVIVSSATLRPREFQAFFEDAVGSVPLVSVKARTYPVTVHYAPVEDTRDRIDRVPKEIARLHRGSQDGHILAFMPGQGAIERTAQALERERGCHDLEVIPLFARLTRDEQDRAFAELPGRRKAVIATNIAETSITIPGIRFVVDTGLAKVPRYDPRTGVTTLREEGISQASAEQRAGRAGRTGPGRVLRLYSEDALRDAPEFTDEEIRRLDLVEVMLRLIDLGVHQVEDFAYPTRPPRRQIFAALDRLLDLGAIDRDRNLTEIGRQMVPFPLSPSLARMVVEAARRYPRVADDVVVLAAFLSMRSPYLFPLGEEVEANRAHSRLAHELGDALTDVGTFRAWSRASNRRNFCERNYLDPDLMAFAERAHDQLAELATAQGAELGRGGPPEQVVRCLGAGFPDRVLLGKGKGRGFETLGGVRVSIHPSSSLFRSNQRLIVATELVESTRTFARHCTVLPPEVLGDVNPEASRRWKIGGRRRGKGKHTPEETPTSIRIGRVELPVGRVGKKPRVDVPWEAVARLRELDPSAVPHEYARWRARLALVQGHFAGGYDLQRLIAHLPYMSIPAPSETLYRAELEGAILDARANWPTIQANLPKLLQPALPDQGRAPGWLAFTANGLGEYWLEVVNDFWAAAQGTALSLVDLERALEKQPERAKLVAEVRERVEAVVEQLGVG